MGEKLNYTNEQKLEFLKKRIFSTIMSGEPIDKAGFDDLKRKIPEYTKLKFNLDDVLFEYKNLEKISRGGASKTEAFLNDNHFVFYGTTKSFSSDIGMLVQLFTTATHELTHVVDYLEVQNSKSDRQLSINNIKGLTSISAKYDKDSEEYKTIAEFQKAYYYTSRSEVFARKSSILHTQNFLNELCEYRKEQFPDTPEMLEEYDNYMNAVGRFCNGEECEIPKLSPEAEKYAYARLVEETIDKKFHEIEERQEVVLGATLITKNQNLPKIKEDFETSLENFLDPNCLDEKYAEMDIFGAAELMFFKEFYNPELAKKLYDYAVKDKSWATALELAEHKDLGISDAEKKRLQNEIDKSVANYQKQNQSQQSFENTDTFTMD